MIMESKPKQKAFTLIELLVVIAIIALLASIVLIALGGARTKARDTKRIADLSQIGVALQLYYNDNSTYPNCGEWSLSTDSNWQTTGCLQIALKPYISSLPIDPLNAPAGGPWDTGHYLYAYGVANGGADYDLVGELEQQTNSDVCQYKQWRFHADGNAVWCNSGWSPYMIEDH
jgi:prepilin-type N-terminal cleavage/methylation domain-containing protein